jgi:hypothetical protein
VNNEERAESAFLGSPEPVGERPEFTLPYGVGREGDGSVNVDVPNPTPLHAESDSRTDAL